MLRWSGTEEELNKSYGIYAIADDKKIIYIGSTKRPFKKRFEEHSKNFNLKTNHHLYGYMPQEKLNMYPLICLDRLQYVGITEKTLKRNREYLEWALILFLQPECNIEGRSKPFVFLREKRKQEKKLREIQKHSPW